MSATKRLSALKQNRFTDIISDFLLFGKKEKTIKASDEKLRSARFFILAFAVPFIIVLFCAYIMDIAPFGERTLMAIDAWGQYFPMLREMKRAVRSLDFSYSFSGALGFDLTAQSAYYTNSPLWYLLFLLPGELTPGQVDMMVFIRFGLAGLSFSYYLSEHFGKKSNAMIFLATGYAFSGYTLAFINQFMWMDSVLLLPLVLLGIERLVKGKGLVLYTLSLFFAIYTNFYIAYAICIFSVIWFFLQIFTEWQGIKASFMSAVRFGLCSLCAGALNTGVLLPLLRAIRNTLASDMGFGGELEMYHKTSELLRMLMPFNEPSLAFEAPNIYFGAVAIPLCLLAVFSKAAVRKKIGYGFVALFMLLSFNFNLLDFIWHGFHFPNQLPGRQSFLFIFTALVIACSGLDMLFSLVKNKKVLKNIFTVVFSVAMCFEIFLNTVFFFGNYAKYVSMGSILRNETALTQVSDGYMSDKDENEFWRIETVPHRYNGGQLYGYNGISHYSSTMSGDCYNFFLQLGMERYARNVSIEYVPNPVVNALFGVRYLASTEEYSDGIVRYVEKADNMYIYENPAALPLFYVAERDVLNVDMSLQGYAFANDIFTRAAGCEEVIHGITLTDSEGKPVSSYELNRDEFLKGIDNLLLSRCEITDFGRTKIKGSVNAEKDGVLIISLPAKDVKVEIDGEEAQVLTIAGYMAGVEVTKGEKTITIKLP